MGWKWRGRTVKRKGCWGDRGHRNTRGCGVDTTNMKHKKNIDGTNGA